MHLLFSSLFCLPHGNFKKPGKKFNKKQYTADQGQEISHYHQKDIL